MSMNYVDLIKKIAKIAAGLANRSASKSVLLFMYYYSFINIILVFICWRSLRPQVTAKSWEMMLKLKFTTMDCFLFRFSMIPAQQVLLTDVVE